MQRLNIFFYMRLNQVICRRARWRASWTSTIKSAHASKCRLYDVIFAKYSLANCIQRRERCKPSSGETIASARTPTPNRRLRRALYESSTPSAKFSGLSAVDGGLQMSESSGIPARRKLSTNCRTLSREARSRRVMV